MTIHVMPVGDLIEHLSYPECMCGPTEVLIKNDDGSIGWISIHHSLDGREIREGSEEE